MTRHVADLVAGLDRERWLIEAACPPDTDSWRELADRGVVLHPLRSGKEPTLSDAGDLRRILQLAAGADVVHAHASKAGFLTRLAAALLRRRARAVFTPHGWSFWAREWRSRGWLALERRAARWGAAIVAVSEAERRAGVDARVGTPEQYVVIRNGIDPTPFARPRRAVHGRILMVGRLAPAKRPDIAIRALASVRKRHPEAQLDIAAHGPLEEEAKTLARELGLGDAVRFLGKRHDVPELLAEADCFLLTSDHEGAPYTVLEAMAAGVPVVSTRVGGVPELVEDGVQGILFDPGDPDAGGAALDRVLGAPEMGQRLGEAGRERVRREFGRQRMARETAALYESLL